MAYAAPADLASYLQVPSVDTASATLILDMVSSQIDYYIGRPLGQVVETGVLLDGPAAGSDQLVLPGFPISAIASLEVAEPDGTWTTLVDGTDFHWSTSGVVSRIFPAFDPNNPAQPQWPTWAQSIRASYTHDDPSVSTAIKGVCLAASARLYLNPAGIQSEQIGGMSIRYSAKGGGVEFSVLEQRTLDRLSMPIVA